MSINRINYSQNNEVYSIFSVTLSLTKGSIEDNNISSMKKFYVYILKCSDNSYYTGITNNIERRFSEHNEGIDPKCYTYKRRPVELVYYEEFQTPAQAIEKEKQIKGWSRAKKEALITGDYERLVELAKSRKE